MAEEVPGTTAGSASAVRTHWSRVLVLGKVVVAAGVLWLLVKLELLDLSPLHALLEPWWFVAVACFALLTIWPLVAWRWLLLLRAQNLFARFRDVFRIAYGSAFLGLYLPGTVGTDLARIGFGLSLPRSHVTVLTLSVLADRIVGVAGLLLVGVVASIAYLAYLDPGVPGYAEIRSLVLVLAALFAAAGVAVLLGALLARRLHDFAQSARWAQRGLLLRIGARVIEACRLYGDSPRSLLRALAISVVVHSITFAVLASIAWKLGISEASPWKYAIAGAIAAIVNSLSITPGGIGVGELAFAQILLWLEPASRPVPYATVFLTHRLLTALTLLPALAFLPNPFRRVRG